MPFRLIFFFTLLTPLLGIVQVEAGAFAPNVNVWGAPNGATYAFIAYAIFALVGVWATAGVTFFRGPGIRPPPPVRAARRLVAQYNTLAVAVSGCLCALMLLVFGGLTVLSGDVSKGEFRTSLGGLGALAYLTLKWLGPCIFAFGCALYVFAGKPRFARKSLLVVGLLTFVIGISWGFKGSALLITAPGIAILLWFARLRSLVPWALAGIGSLLLAFNLFDTLDNSVYESAVQFLIARLTIFQGDVSWYIWDLWRSGEPLPDYWTTPLVAVGDRLFSVITGITRDDAELWVTSHYGSLLTYTVGYPIEGIEAGHSVTGTPFSEALFALGIAGIPVFGLLAGIVTGVVYKRIARAMAEGRPMSAALWSNYFVWFVFAWLNAGDMAQLFHVSAIIGAVAAKLMLSFMAGLLRLAPSSPPDTLQSVRTP
jgi:hypothetical protein